MLSFERWQGEPPEQDAFSRAMSTDYMARFITDMILCIAESWAKSTNGLALKLTNRLRRMIYRHPLQWRHSEHDDVSNRSLTIVYSPVYSDTDQRKH